jgi:hypothetical protein
MSNARPTFLALGALLAVAGLTACGSTTTTAPLGTAPVPGLSASAAATTAPSKAAPAKTATSITAACTAITSTVNGAYADAQRQAQAKHAQDPAISVSDLTGAYLTGNLKDDARAIGAAEAVAGVTPGLKTAEQRLLVAVRNLYANYGQTAAEVKYGGEAQAAVNEINRECT